MSRAAQPTDELDLQLLHLLQIAPRVSWVAAGSILGLSASAVASRWSRLVDSGVAWLSVYRSNAADRVTAFVHVSCVPKRRAEVATRLCNDRRVASIDASAGGRDFTLTVMVDDMAALGDFVYEELHSGIGVLESRTQLVTRVFAEGSDWRLDALDASQRAEAGQLALASAERSAVLSDADRDALIGALAGDARMSIADLARTVGGNAATVRRQVGQLFASGVIVIRCDVAPAATGWPIECSWLARVPAAELTQTAMQLRRMPQTRLCASVTGESNLVLSTVNRRVADLTRFEQHLGEVLPRMQILESLPTLRPLKRMGHLLDAAGFATGEVVRPVRAPEL